MPHAVLAFLFTVAAASACGCSSKSTPNAPSRTITDVRITGPTALLISQSVSYSVMATYSDGTSSAESATWTSSSTAVAEISSAGQLTALTTGSTNLSATVSGRTATLAVQVTNPLVGQWVLTASTNPGTRPASTYAPRRSPRTSGFIGQTFTATIGLSANQFTQSAPFPETWTRVQ